MQRRMIIIKEEKHLQRQDDKKELTMEQQKIVFVSHCALNTAAKVQRSAQEGEQEEKLRREFEKSGGQSI